MDKDVHEELDELLARKKPGAPPIPAPTIVQVGPDIALLNESSKFSTADLAQAAVALQLQVSLQFGPLWGTNAKLYAAKPPVGAWQIHLVDYPGAGDPAGALGYHDLGADGLPYGRVFVGTALDHGITPSSVISHELLEILADPFVYSTVFVQDSNTTGVLYMLEACDAPEAEDYLIGGIQVSNFVNRKWWIPGSVGPWDYLGHIAGPLRLLSGGYIGVDRVTVSSGWGAQQASLPPALQPSLQVGINPRHVMWLPGQEPVAVGSEAK